MLRISVLLILAAVAFGGPIQLGVSEGRGKARESHKVLDDPRGPPFSSLRKVVSSVQQSQQVPDGSRAAALGNNGDEDEENEEFEASRNESNRLLPFLLDRWRKPRCFEGELIEHWYKSCELREVTPRCYDIKCPEEKLCESQNGTLYQMDGPSWTEVESNSMKWTCDCVYPAITFWYAPREPEGAPEYPPVKHCQLEGCENMYTEEFMEPGAVIFIPERNTTCRCLAGSDPYLMDGITKFHFYCDDFSPPSRFYTNPDY